MAENILKLRVDSDEYNNKIKRATEDLQRYAEGCRKVGGTLEHVDEGVEEFVKALGQMQTVSKSAKGSVSELTKSFTELSVMYNKLTEEEKQGTFGKALAQSLETLKGRIQDGNAELKDIGKSLNDTGGFLGQLKDKFTINIDALKLFNAGVTAAKAALDVAKDAFFASEATVDEWGRVMDSSKSLYEGFLTALNTGDISGYLSRIDSIVQAARAAYNELDRLGTMKTIQAPQMSAQQTENERMRMMIQTGRYIAPVDGRKASMQNGQLLTPDQIKRIEQQLQNGMQKVVTLVGNEVAQTGRAIDAVYNRQAQELGMSLKEFRKGTSSMAEFDKRMAGYDQYQQWRAAHTTIDIKSGRETVARGNPYEQFAKWGTFRVDGDRYNDLVKLIQQRDQQAGQAYSMQSQAYRTMNRAEGVTLRQLMGGGGSGGGGGRNGGVSTEITYAADSITAMEKEVSELTKLWKDAGAAVRDQYAAQLAEAKLRLDEINGKSKKIMFDSEQAAKQVGFSQGKNAAQTSGLGNIDSFKNFKVEGLSPEALEAANKWIHNMVEGGNQVQKSWKNAASAIGMVGSAMASVKDPAAQIASTVAMAIANIAMAYSETLAKDKTNKSNIWYFIATAAAAMVSMTTTIASIHSATGYAQGGEIKGNSYSGDNIAGLVDGKQLVGLNAGEIVLNQAQQANVAHGLQGAGGNLHLEGILQGENILIAANRTAKRKGYGEMMFWQGG